MSKNILVNPGTSKRRHVLHTQLQMGGRFESSLIAKRRRLVRWLCSQTIRRPSHWRYKVGRQVIEDSPPAFSFLYFFLSLSLILFTMLSRSAIFYWGSLISAALATPITTLPCNPDYPPGKPISIGNSQFIGLSDGAKSGSGLIKATTAPFLFSQTKSGTGSPLYTIR